MAPRADNLQNSVEHLAAVAAAVSDDVRMAHFTEVERAGLRAGVVKNFEIAYELAWKLMQRWLQDAGVQLDQLTPTRQGLFRLAAQYGLVADTERWMEHHRHRNTTAHQYDAAKADIVAAAVQRFIEDARHLIARLEQSPD